ncbi:hypothetical protein LTR70_006949 [Exophiala xenobiotica]|uniref:Uncharacterized protein n=1 Tax=Lithohypha guttulata TaxID=1690604 RepID=A0ABR0K7C6_9EURO|nr:hypothetical protein LTR24_006597 [Lithohypha guttulata]KAK5314908.1 hypothetical protein LTR70_006949 [Exophiala xenobiotica]
MYEAAGRPVRTAQRNSTIWSRVSEDEFRRNLVALEERTNAVPSGVLVFPLQEETTDTLRLPLKVEQHVADDLAFLAAVQEGAQSVAAVCLEQHLRPKAVLRIRIAAADFKDESLRAAMTHICDILRSVSRGGSYDVNPADELLDQIVKRHQYKILGRLRSRKWEKPQYLAASHKKPLWKDFENVIHRVQHVYPTKKEKAQKKNVEGLLKALAECYSRFEDCERDELILQLRALVKSTYEFCTCREIGQFAARLAGLRPTTQIAAAVKCLHQLEKIGAYERVSIDLVGSALQYPSVFGDVELEYLSPYASVPTSLAYEPWAKTCHVHAEIQLVIDSDLPKVAAGNDDCEMFMPRVVGTSKYLCYLCYLFIKYHGRFIAPNTHGRLYDQWTVPDLAEYHDKTREHYAKVLAEINEVVLRQIAEGTCWRAEPMTSRQNLLLQ